MKCIRTGVRWRDQDTGKIRAGDMFDYGHGDFMIRGIPGSGHNMLDGVQAGRVDIELFAYVTTGERNNYSDIVFRIHDVSHVSNELLDMWKKWEPSVYSALKHFEESAK